MPHWPFDNDHEAAAVMGLRDESDRAAAIIAATILESRLEQKIKGRLRAGSESRQSKAILEELFRAGGAIGSFHIKVQVGFMMRIYGIRTYKELQCIKDIRNRFAHHIDVRDFNSHSIKSKASNLTIVDEYMNDIEKSASLMPQVSPDNAAIANARRYLSSPKARYVSSCALFTSWLAGHILGGHLTYEAIAGDGDAPPFPDISA
jgi:hypothetical protein